MNIVLHVVAPCLCHVFAVTTDSQTPSNRSVTPHTPPPGACCARNTLTCRMCHTPEVPNRSVTPLRSPDLLEVYQHGMIIMMLDLLQTCMYTVHAHNRCMVQCMHMASTQVVCLPSAHTSCCAETKQVSKSVLSLIGSITLCRD
jgi:hypothetical protein